MLTKNRRKTNVGVAIATALQLIGLFLSQTWGIAVVLGLILILISILVFIWGCSNYAEGKGYSKWVGMVGVAGLIGLIILIMLPEQNREGSAHRLQMHKLIGLISMVLGLGLAVLGRWLGDLAYRSAFTGGEVLLEESSADVCMVVGICVTLIGLILLMSNTRKNKIGKSNGCYQTNKEQKCVGKESTE